uniref:Mitochondria-eating protein n=1 Tax=Crassostrea virginica TaxID=6565 RepID=A0A8B8DI40_CRAVI|nr:uncharacterized protein LOC111127081 isoform X2 [Crassostrea virginica]
MAESQVPMPIHSEQKPSQSSKNYIKGVLQDYEEHSNYADALKEYKELLTAKDIHVGMSTLGPVVPFKEEKVTEEQREYKPNLAGILLTGCKDKVKNSSLAWREYTDFVVKHKKATFLKETTESSGQVEGEKSIVLTQETKGSDFVDSQSGKEQETAKEKAAPPAGKKEVLEKAQPLKLFDLLGKDENKDSEEFEEAHQDLIHMFTCNSVLESSFPQVDILRHVTVNIDKPDDVPFFMRERALFRYLVNLKPETYDNHFHDIWREYGTYLIAENLLDLARKAKGPDRSIYLVVEKRMFYELQSELQKKTEEADELSTRLSRFASQQLTEGNPNIADLSDIHRPTRLGEMYSQLFDDEWSEAFEALKPNMKKGEEEDDEDELYPNILTLLHSILEESFTFCKEKSTEQLQKLENKIKEGLKTTATQSEEKMDVDQSPSRGKDDKMEEEPSQTQSMLDQTVERHSKELRKAASVETARIQTQVFMKEKLPSLLQDEKVRQDPRVVSYVTKCVELCWYMCMQDPPMKLAVPKKGETMDKNLFSFHGRKGRVVNCCVWAALLLHKDGPLVCKGYVLPEERKKK